MRKLNQLVTIVSVSIATATLAATATAQHFGPGGAGSGRDMMGPGMMGPGFMGRGGFAGTCSPGAAGFLAWRIDRIEQVIKPTDAQRAKFDDLKAASDKAAEALRLACPTEVPTTAVGRMEFTEKRMEAMLRSVKTIRPAFEAFYANRRPGWIRHPNAAVSGDTFGEAPIGLTQRAFRSIQAATRRHCRMGYYFSKTLPVGFDEAAQRAAEALKQGGFGIITEIDVKRTFKEKLGTDFRNYRILGACNPKLAYEALQLEDKVGTMLPCNVVVQEIAQNRTEIAAIDPVASMQAIDNPELNASAQRVQALLRKVIESL